MEKKICKNKKCQRTLPVGYKHKYCENCRNEHAKTIKDIGKTSLGLLLLIGGTVISVVTNRKKI